MSENVRREDRQPAEEWADVVRVGDPEEKYPVLIDDVSENGVGIYCYYELPLGSQWHLHREGAKHDIEISTLWGEREGDFYRYGAIHTSALS